MGRLLLVGHNTTPFLRVYDTADWGLTDDAATFHAVNITGAVQGAALNPAQSMLAFGMPVAPFFNVMNLADGTDVTITSGKPASAVNECAFSHDGTKLAVSLVSSPYLTVYNVADWSKITLTGGDIPGQGYKTHWSPDGSKLAVGSSAASYITVYNVADWSKITLTGGDVASTAWHCRFSPDGTKLAVGHSNSPYLTVYNVADWSKITLTGGDLPVNVLALGWSYDGGLLAVIFNVNPYVVIYNTTDWSKLPSPSVLPAGAGKCALFTDAWQTKVISTSPGNVVTDDLGAPAARTVRVIDRYNGRLLKETNSDGSGNYSVKLLTTSEKQVIYLDDAASTIYNDLINRVLPG